MKLFNILVFYLIYCCSLKAQTYAPGAGQSGTTAMYKDSSAFINWVQKTTIIRGYQDLSNIQLGYASVGDSSSATGIAGSNGIVSLGDGGFAVCTFQYPIKNDLGYDFAVFENSFDDTFLELAFVEVSSDGINFFRFPSHSLTDTVTQTGSFDPTDAAKLNNLAGKYRGTYGTPFDLEELANTTNLNINAITHVKVIDVVGSINPLYARRDSYQNKINDPWPTPFASSGFDLDAIGVIHQNTSVGIKENNFDTYISIYPNPLSKGELINIQSSDKNLEVILFDVSGQKLLSTTNKQLNSSDLDAGIYFVKILSIKNSVIKKIIIR